jgi:hypothetical protein
MPPAPLQPANAFAINRQGKVSGVMGKQEVEAFFSKHLPAVKDEEAAKEAVRARGFQGAEPLGWHSGSGMIACAYTKFVFRMYRCALPPEQ